MTAYEKPSSAAGLASVAEGAAAGASRLSVLQAARSKRGSPRAAHFLSMRGSSPLEGGGGPATPGPRPQQGLWPKQPRHGRVAPSSQAYPRSRLADALADRYAGLRPHLPAFPRPTTSNS